MSIDIKKNFSLKPFSWWKVGGDAEFCCFPKDLDELRSACQFAQEKDLKINILSGGTNTLISDSKIDGLVIILNQLQGIEIKKTDDVIYVDLLSGTPKTELFKICCENKLAAAFFLCGLPGDIGGGVVMNAGIGQEAPPRDFADIIDTIEVLHFSDLKIHTFKKEDLEWNYRSCSGWGDGIIYRSSFKLKNIQHPEFSKVLKEFHKKRVTTQPLNKPSCGSVFKNPSGHKSGQLIEKLGLKGYKIGGAEVSRKHANFILNTGDAKAFDIYQLICHIQKEVKEKLGVDLETEVRRMGTF